MGYGLRTCIKGVFDVTDFKLQQVNENELKSVENKRGN
jgi:hypothetical protein